MKLDKETVNNNTVQGTQYIGYQGRVSISVIKENKILTTRHYYNSGMPKLFEFLAKCLGGARSEYLRPAQIKLFNYSAADEIGAEKPTEFTWNTAFNKSGDKSPCQASPFRPYDATPIIRKVTDPDSVSETEENSQYEVTLHFTVPAAFLAENVIHFVGLYPNNANSDADDVAAYYLFTDEKGKEWEPLDFSEISGNFSIFIEWTLTVSNKKVKK